MNSSLEHIRKVKSRETVSIQSTGSRKDRYSCSELQAKSKSNIITDKSSGIYGTTFTVRSEATLKGSSSAESYFLTQMARLESDVDHWMDTCYCAGDRREPPTRDGQQMNRETSGGSLMDLWYTLALLPMLNCYGWRSCSLESSVLLLLKSLDLMTRYLEQIMSSVREQILTVIDQIYKEYFSLGMDILLVLHAFAFLVLSVYQAAVTC